MIDTRFEQCSPHWEIRWALVSCVLAQVSYHVATETRERGEVVAPPAAFGFEMPNSPSNMLSHL